jgi:hypothetical protein
MLSIFIVFDWILFNVALRWPDAHVAPTLLSAAMCEEYYSLSSNAENLSFYCPYEVDEPEARLWPLLLYGPVLPVFKASYNKIPGMVLHQVKEYSLVST